MIGSTMGVSTPATAGDGHAKPYRYRGDPDWTPGDRRYRDKTTEPSGGSSLHNLKSSASRRERLAEFASYLEQGLTAAQAGKLLKIAPKTARTYWRELKEQQREEDA